MKNDLNQCTFSGNLTNDPEIRVTPKGTTIANFSLAVNSTWRDRETREIMKSTEFHDFRCYGQQAEFVRKYLVRGMGVVVNCKAVKDTWESKTEKNSEGEPRKRSKVIFEAVARQGITILPSARGNESDEAEAPESSDDSDEVGGDPIDEERSGATPKRNPRVLSHRE